MLKKISMEARASARGRKLLLPINQPHFEIVGIEWKALTKQISAAIEVIRQALESGKVLPQFDISPAS
jgi:hypothetical protein